MKKLHMVLFACLSLFMISCTAQQTPEESIVKDTLVVEIDPSQNQFQKGVPSKIIFHITNNSDDLIVIRTFDVKGALPDITRWYGSLYGATLYKPLEDMWEYSPMAQTLSDPVFVMSLIVPGSEIKINRMAVLKDDWVQIEVGCQRLAKEQIKEYLYLADKNADHFRQTNILLSSQSLWKS